ncbi:MAG: glycosyltransferase family 4 protein [Agarilytica sp.]
MKLLFLSNYYPFPVYADGATVRVFHLLKEMSKRADVEYVYIGDTSGLTNEDLEGLKSLKVPFHFVSIRNTRNIQSVAKKIFSEKRFYSKDAVNKIALIVEKVKPDIIFCEQPFSAALVGKVKVPVYVSSVDCSSLAAKKASMRVTSSLIDRVVSRYICHQRSRFEKKYLNDANGVSVVAQEDADVLGALIKKPVDVIPNGVDFNKFNAPGYHADGKFVLFTGNLSSRSSMNEEAALFLISKSSDLFKKTGKKTRIAGRAPSNRILQACQECRYVELMPDLENMESAFEDVFLYVCPVIYGTGIKNTVLQAASMGVPCLITTLVADPAEFEDGISAFIDNDRERWPDLIVNFDREKLMLVGENGKTHITSNFTWENISDHHLRRLQEIIDLPL